MDGNDALFEIDKVGLVLGDFGELLADAQEAGFGHDVQFGVRERRGGGRLCRHRWGWSGLL